MKSLNTIQKTFRAFQILTKIGMILSFVWAGLAAIGILCGIVWYRGGIVIGASREVLFSLTMTDGPFRMVGALLSDMVFALTDGTLLMLATRYFAAEQMDGTPFTVRGAQQIKRLGIRTIVFPLVAAILTSVFYQLFDIQSRLKAGWNNMTSVSLGIVLILAGLIFRYGAELEPKDTQGRA